MALNRSVLPDYPFKISFENNFIPLDAQEFMKRNRRYAVYACLIYIPLIFGIKLFMKNRKGFELRTPLIIWNFLLAGFSLIVACRTSPELIYVLKNFSFYYSICVSTNFAMDTVYSFWGFMFTLSKLPELIDTIFIVLRKRPLIFLHWYHHVTVLLYTWFIYSEIPSTGRWFCAMNAAVHSIMYSYYGLMAMGIKSTKFLAIFITLLQLMQMIAGIAINLFAFYYKITYGTASCSVSMTNFFYTFIMYFSYFILFAKFFKQSYMNKPKKVDSMKKE